MAQGIKRLMHAAKAALRSMAGQEMTRSTRRVHLLAFRAAMAMAMDTIIGNNSEDDRGSYIYGNAGDVLIVLKDTPAHQRGSLADGGAGNGTISTLTYLGGNETDDILTGCEGADRFELGFGFDFHIDNYDETEEPEIVTIITDFVPVEDVLSCRSLCLSMRTASTTASFQSPLRSLSPRMTHIQMSSFQQRFLQRLLKHLAQQSARKSDTQEQLA